MTTGTTDNNSDLRHKAQQLTTQEAAQEKLSLLLRRGFTATQLLQIATNQDKRGPGAYSSVRLSDDSPLLYAIQVRARREQAENASTQAVAGLST